jgi:protein O-mannosyl-transferase
MSVFYCFYVVNMFLFLRQFLIISIIILAEYYPAIFAETCILDDRSMLLSMSSVKYIDLSNVFFPNSSDGLYYRPLIHLSFLFDRFVWGLEPAIMHFENILIHLTSAILIFIIARQIISKSSIIPLFAALIFATHPIATESVNWISGRTDLLAVMLVLISLYFIIYSLKSNKLLWFAVSFVSLILGVMAKETTLGFIPALVFIMTSKTEQESLINNEPYVEQYSVILFLFSCTLSIASVLLIFNHYIPIFVAISYFFYLFLLKGRHFSARSFQKNFVFFSVAIFFIWALFGGIRTLAFSSNSTHVQKTFELLFSDMNYTLSLFFRAVGFYTKKFIWPLPLNFAIRDISPFYSLVGIVLLCLVAVLIVRRRIHDSLVIAGFCMVVPVLPLTFESVAWTSYAERYVYPATPFWILAISGYASSAGFDRLPPRIYKLCLVGLSLLILAMACITFQRNLIWQTNIALLHDTVKRTPDYKPLRGLYVVALFEKGMYDEALVQHKILQTLNSIELKYNPSYDLNYSQILIAKEDYEKAEQELDHVEKRTDGMHPDVYELYLEFASRMLLQTSDDQQKMRIVDKMYLAFDKFYELKKDPMILYRRGQFLLSLDKRDEAGIFFTKAAEVFPENNPYRRYANKLARNLTTCK